MSNGSMASLSSLTSISSRAALETYETLKDDIAHTNMANLEDLVRDAEKIINQQFAPDPRHIYTYRRGDDTISVNLDKVMSTMLENAEECGGDDATRYVASAILACTRREDVVEALVALSAIWLTHFLFVFKTSRSRETQPNQHPDELATPTLDGRTSHVRRGVAYRDGAFRDDVMMRDGYMCVLTGFQDISHPLREENFPYVDLKACHILPRAIAKFNEDPKSDSLLSTTTTFDILANYARLPKETFEDLQRHLDDPSNGMMLQNDARDAYDKFRWCLKSTDRDNVYTVKIFEKAGILHLPPNNLVIFRDHSNDLNPLGNTRKRKRYTPLPNARYLAIHAAIAGILHMSGAGKFFDELLKMYKDDEGNVPPVRSWPELEKIMEVALLRDSVQALNLVGVH